MSCNNKASRQLIAKHAPWFKRSNYDNLSTANPETWFIQFALRIDLQRMRIMRSSRESAPPSAHEKDRALLVCRLREAGVIERQQLEAFLEGANALSNEDFATLVMGMRDGVCVRAMNIEDVELVLESLEQKRRYDEKLESLPANHPIRLRARAAQDATVDRHDSIYQHLQPGIMDLSQLLMSVDLSLPRAFLKRQFEELVDQHQRLRANYLPRLVESKLPAHKAWQRSKVLGYIDLSTWRSELPDEELKGTIQDADVAAALGIGTKMLFEMTKVHAKNLTDPNSVVFMHMTETAISYRRGPLRPLRNTVRKRLPVEEN
jgi:hypothetical protein